ncbi:MAG: DNA polymerase IV [Tissierellia bacterium]|nr:DNA polymerase IV [Tissierellia bacterium]
MSTIMHVDMDAFYASVEAVDNPHLTGKPFVVGKDSSKGIVTTASYEAREFGIHSAMPIFMAKQRCPNLIIVPMRRDKYVEVSKILMEIYESVAYEVEQVSIDEAYLDLGDYPIDKIDMAILIKRRIMEQTGLTASIGQSYNKFLAKLASEWKKPNGFTIITPNMIPELLMPLPVNKIHGIGPKTESKLNDMGIRIVSDMIGLSMEVMEGNFGKMGPELYERIRGIDNRPVVSDRKRKSMGVERTFSETANREKLLDYLNVFCLQLEKDLIKSQLQGKTLTIKIKDGKFRQYTRSMTLEHPIFKSKDLFKYGERLMQEMIEVDRVRLLGVTLSHLMTIEIEQLGFLDGEYKVL